MLNVPLILIEMIAHDGSPPKVTWNANECNLLAPQVEVSGNPFQGWSKHHTYKVVKRPVCRPCGYHLPMMGWSNTVSGWVQCQKLQRLGWALGFWPDYCFRPLNPGETLRVECPKISDRLFISFGTREHSTSNQESRNTPPIEQVSSRPLFQCYILVFIPHSYFEKKGGPPAQSLGARPTSTLTVAKALGGGGSVMLPIIPLTARPLFWQTFVWIMWESVGHPLKKKHQQ